MNTRAFALSASLAGFVAAACSVTPATQFTVGVTSQILVPEDVQAVRITASTGGNRGFCETYPVVDGKARLPQSLALAPDVASDPTLQVTINVMGFSVSSDRVKNEGTYDDCTIPIVSPSDGSTEDLSSAPPNARVLRRSKQPYLSTHDLYVPMPLKYSCYGVNCNGDQTCKGGVCVDSAVDVATLPDFDEALLFGDSSACFSETACLGDAVGPNVIDATSCIYEVPSGTSLASVGMNVRAIYEPYRAEVLDLDPVEGFTIPDASKPNQFKLAPGLCAGGLGPKIKNLVASTTCAAKNAFQPLCQADATTTILPPAPSLVYLVVDQDQSMVDYVGTKNAASTSADKTGSLDDALALALADPVFLTTDIAFRFVPDAGSECTSTTYGTPQKFDAALPSLATIDVAAQSLADFVGQTLPTTTSGFPVNQLLSSGGVYHITLPTTASFNKKALAVVTNRSFDPTLATACSPNGAAAAVQAATSQGWTTYLFSLRNAFEAPATTQARIDAAKAFATASGATLVAAEGGASGDEDQAKASAAEGLAQVVASLGGCLYDKPSNLSTATGATLTLKPAGPFAPMTLPADATCTATSTTANGWAIDADNAHIRVCGAACTSIQTAIEENALATAQRSQSGQVMPGQVLVELTTP